MIQTLLLPLSLTPTWLPFLSSIMRRHHYLLLIAHLAVFMFAFNVMKKRDAGMAEMMRWALPEIVAGAVEIQRRSELDSARGLRQLGGLKYHLKGP